MIKWWELFNFHLNYYISPGTFYLYLFHYLSPSLSFLIDLLCFPVHLVFVVLFLLWCSFSADRSISPALFFLKYVYIHVSLTHLPPSLSLSLSLMGCSEVLCARNWQNTGTYGRDWVRGLAAGLMLQRGSWLWQVGQVPTHGGGLSKIKVSAWVSREELWNK